MGPTGPYDFINILLLFLFRLYPLLFSYLTPRLQHSSGCLQCQVLLAHACLSIAPSFLLSFPQIAAFKWLFTVSSFACTCLPLNCPFFSLIFPPDCSIQVVVYIGQSVKFCLHMPTSQLVTEVSQSSVLMVPF